MKNVTQKSELELSVVIPIYNEADNLAILNQELQKHLPPLKLSYEILMVDDGSRDNSVEIIKGLQKENPHLRLIRFKKNCGQTAAFAAGFEAVRGNIIITMDADLQNSPEDIPKLVEKMGDYDVVCGWRQKRNDPWIKRVSSKIANYVRNRLSDENIADTGCSLKAFRRHCFADIKLYKGMHRFFPTLMKMEGFRVTQVPVNHYPRRFGESKYNIRNRLFSSFIDLLAVRWMKQRNLEFEIIEED